MSANRTAADRMRKYALNLFLAPTTVLVLFVVAAIYDPGTLIEYWRFYLPMFGIPYVIALGLWLFSRRLRSRDST